MAEANALERPPLSTIVGTNLYRLRVLKVPKLSREALAALSGVASNTIALIELSRMPGNHQNNPQLDTIEALAQGLGVDATELLLWEEAKRVVLQGQSPAFDLIHGDGSAPGGPSPLMVALSP